MNEKILKCKCGFERIYNGHFKKINYKCPKCGEQFTTTESDDLSMKTWKIKYTKKEIK